jgi:hypothetical protein
LQVTISRTRTSDMPKTAEKPGKVPKRNLVRPYQCNTLLSKEEDDALTELSVARNENKSTVVRTAIMKLHTKEVGKK